MNKYILNRRLIRLFNIILFKKFSPRFANGMAYGVKWGVDILFLLVKPQENKQKNLFSKRYKFESVHDSKRRFSYRVLSIKHSSLINSKKTVQLIGKNRVLMADGLYKLCKIPYPAIYMESYEQCLLKSGIESLLTLKAGEFINKSVTLVDLSCKYQAIADILVKSFKIVRIITRRDDLYCNYAVLKLYECGAVVVVLTRFSMDEDTTFFISPDGALCDKLQSHKATVITANPISELAATADFPAIHSFRSVIPPEYEELLPVGIDGHSLLAALYRYCGLRDNRITTSYTAVINGVKQRISAIKDCVE